MSLLSIEQVEHSYFGRQVLAGISLRLDRGERLALIGENGSGKTTLMRLIVGLEKPDAGRIVLAGQAVTAYLSQQIDLSEYAGASSLLNPQLARLEARMRDLEHEIADAAARSQSAEQQAVAATASAEPEAIETALKSAATAKAEGKRLLTSYADTTAAFEALGGYDFEHRMNEALRGLGLAEDVITRPVESLSGGEKMRVALARILLSDPDLLLLDEPTNHLDLEAMEWLERYLVSFKGAVLLISHDRTFIDHTATSVAELAAGRVTVRPGNYTQFREIEAAEQYTLSREIKKMERELEHQKDVTQTMLSHRKMSSYHAREKVVAKLTAELGQIRERSNRPGQRLKFSFLPAANEGDPQRILLETEGLSRSFGERVLFRNASFYLRCGERLFLLGPNGCGKSTLLSVLLGRLTADSGTVKLSSRSVFGLMSQEFNFPDENATVVSTLTSGYELAEGQARNLLARYGFRDVDVYKSVGVLSGGERARLYLCHLLLDRPDLLFLDEPTNHLDIRSREILESALLEYTGALLVVSHDRYLIERLATRVLGFVGTSVLPFDSYATYTKARDKAADTTTGEAPDEKTKGKNSTQEKSANSAATAEAEPAFKANPATDTDPAATSDPTTASDVTPPAAAENRQPPQRAMGASRAKERRETALRKERLRELENQIENDEQLKADLESSFSGNTDPELYDSYASLLSELEAAYAEYLELAEELD